MNIETIIPFVTFDLKGTSTNTVRGPKERETSCTPKVLDYYESLLLDPITGNETIWETEGNNKWGLGIL